MDNDWEYNTIIIHVQEYLKKNKIDIVLILISCCLLMDDINDITVIV